MRRQPVLGRPKDAADAARWVWPFRCTERDEKQPLVSVAAQNRYRAAIVGSGLFEGVLWITAAYRV
jgi:hypothetical protein